MRPILTLVSVLFLSGCATKPKPEVEMYLRFDKTTGRATGHIDNEGHRTKIIMEPYEPLEPHNEEKPQISAETDTQ